MNFAWLKRYMPRGLYGRAALILLLPIITLLVVVSVVFIQRHFEDVTRQMTMALALDMHLLQAQTDQAADAGQARARIRNLSGPLQLEVDLPVQAVPARFSRYFYDLSGRVVIETLKNTVPGLRAVDLVHDSRQVVLWLQTRHGLARVSVSRNRVSASNPHQFLVLMVFVGTLMTLIAFIYLRNQLRPIKRLARAAEAFGKGRVVEYRPSGAIEVRAAGNAFLDMRARIERQIEQRTMMLSGVSHDLRTPLTRMKLALSMLEDCPGAADLEGDIADMERLLDDYLAFARADALGDPVPTDLKELLRTLVETSARDGRDVALAPTDYTGNMPLRPIAMKRACGNLIENALRYGSKARVSLLSGEKSVTIRVEDDGPGIAAADREKAMQPFARLDAARNQNKGSGVGLGLSIAQDIARRHGGTLRLGQSEEFGGLKAEIVLPR